MRDELTDASLNSTILGAFSRDPRLILAGYPSQTGSLIKPGDTID